MNLNPPEDEATDRGTPPVVVERDGHVALLQLNRPDQLNALSPELLGAIVQELEALQHDHHVRVVVLAGTERAFASGADIQAMIDAECGGAYFMRRRAQWLAVWAIEVPLVAAVSGYCLGGGCELAMACDIIVASETAVFGLPETRLGIIPGAGGTQRLVRAIGKAKAMDVVLTGRRLTSGEAEQAGLIARIAPADAWLETALAVARDVAAAGPHAARLAKRSVQNAFEKPLSAGLAAEWAAFGTAFASAEAQEGLRGFLEKRSPDWRE